MIIEFANLTKEEKEQLVQLEQTYPESVVLTDIVAGFDGETATQLITQLGPSVIAGITAIIVAILNRKNRDKPNATITIIFNDGNKELIEKVEDITKLGTYE